ncbi:L-lactate dehydrogenase [Fonsecaea pedrosoi CBS 271.37]|uniref:Unplaced genomic scaffold supercont1.3, whole genome shotgun sequence n=1 Tax=Fonsecaea pedrosoi CBS 271.37 TaxID=1442368 RepID=A0A0D2F7Z7_9EURO|nr:L-lactate dehydrogenase [Fonsecaea pedrosoi CBS 271.37]KIW82722.1 L-lactate dehydrogenase [Fonsecaea pedrosoi CBS 271.37]
MEPTPMDPEVVTGRSRIAILGAGSVGSAIALCLILNPVASEILLVDPNTKQRDAQVRDLEDTTTYHGAVGGGGVRIRSATHREAGQCDIVVISAGAKQRQGESRTDLLGRNLAILKSATDDMKPFREDTVILLVANPVDILTYFCQKFSGLPQGQIIGSGTFLDTARLRGILAAKLGVDAGSVDAYVLGEHGESQMVAWSCVTIGAVPLDHCLPPGAFIDRKAVALETKDKAAKIIEAKGATAYGIGALSAAICKSILFDQRNVRPISHWVDQLGCCLSLPVVLGRRGIVRSLSIPLNQEERMLLVKSADALKKLIQEAEATQL